MTLCWQMLWYLLFSQAKYFRTNSKILSVYKYEEVYLFSVRFVDGLNTFFMFSFFCFLCQSLPFVLCLLTFHFFSHLFLSYHLANALLPLCILMQWEQTKISHQRCIFFSGNWYEFCNYSSVICHHLPLHCCQSLHPVCEKGSDICLWIVPSTTFFVLVGGNQ